MKFLLQLENSVLLPKLALSSMAMANHAILNLRIESELKKQAKRLAEADGRSLSNWIKWLIQKEIEAKKTAKSKP